MRMAPTKTFLQVVGAKGDETHTNNPNEKTKRPKALQPIPPPPPLTVSLLRTQMNLSNISGWMFFFRINLVWSQGLLMVLKSYRACPQGAISQARLQGHVPKPRVTPGEKVGTYRQWVTHCLSNKNKTFTPSSKQHFKTEKLQICTQRSMNHK